MFPVFEGLFDEQPKTTVMKSKKERGGTLGGPKKAGQAVPDPDNPQRKKKEGAEEMTGPVERLKGGPFTLRRGKNGPQESPAPV